MKKLVLKIKDKIEELYIFERMHLLESKHNCNRNIIQ